jgi:hypothetical protein
MSFADKINHTIKRTDTTSENITQAADKRIIFGFERVCSVIKNLLDDTTFYENRLFARHHDERGIGVKILLRSPPNDLITSTRILDDIREMFFSARIGGLIRVLFEK